MARAAARESRSRAGARAARRERAEPEPAATDPVARVLVDVPLAHLDRTFDYAVPASMADDARPGVRVKVRFAGKDVDGFLLERAATTDHAGRLAPLRRVVSAEPVLTPAVAELARLVAERCAGTRSDVLRLAVPPRHATTEREPSPPAPPLPEAARRLPAEGGWTAYAGGAAFLRHLRERSSPRAVWSAAPAEDWPARIAEAVAATLAGGRGALVCVPDGKDADRVDAALTAVLGEGHHVVLRADAGPARRYADFLALARGARRVVVGTRGAALAPVADPGLLVVWDDGDDLLAEPRAPYPHARDTLLLRAGLEGAAVLLGAFARSVEAQQLVATGWAREVVAPREEVRRRAQVGVAGGEPTDRDPLARAARVPAEAHRLLREAAATGPVLVQAPRSGWAVGLACERCRAPARCPACTGPLRVAAAGEPPSCRWCARPEPAWRCGECGHRGLRAPVVGEARTAEELGRSLARGRRALVGRRARARHRAGPPRRRRRDPGRRAGGRRRLRGRGAARHVAGARAPRPPHRRGGAAPVGQRGRPRAPRRAGARRRRPVPAGAAGPGPLGPGGLRDPRGRRAPRGPPAAREPPGHGDGGARRGRRRARAAGAPAGHGGARPGAGRAGRPGPAPEEPEVRAVVRAPLAQGPALSRALGVVQRLRSARKLRRSGSRSTRRPSEHATERRHHRGPPGPGRASVRARPALRHRATGRPEGETPMAVQPIRLFGDPVLRTRAVEVVDFDKELRTLVSDLTDTMRDAPGAGLAAPQIGVGLRVFTWFVDGEVGHLVNPVLDLSDEEQDGPEGCLSHARPRLDSRRALRVVARGRACTASP